MELEIRLALVTPSGRRRALQGRGSSLDNGWHGPCRPGVTILVYFVVDVGDDCVTRCRQPFIRSGVATRPLTRGSGGRLYGLRRGDGGGKIPRGCPFRQLTVSWRVGRVRGSSRHVEIAEGLKGRNGSKEFKW